MFPNQESNQNHSQNNSKISPIKSLESFKNPNKQSLLSSNKNEKSNTDGYMKSYCRIRPNNTLYNAINKFELQNNNKTLVVNFTPEIDLNNLSKQVKYKYNFAGIFWTNTKNIDIFNVVCKPIINDLFNNQKNGLIFVYGITNSGKTHTITGTPQDPGLMPISLSAIYNEFQILKQKDNFWNLTCTFIEIYNEEVYDLLSIDRKKIKIIGTSNKFLPIGCVYKNIENIYDLNNALNLGIKNRKEATTNINPNSSRSHTIFRIELSYKDSIIEIEPVSLSIVDLAGAERLNKSGMMGGGAKEAGSINKSLLILKNCIDAMEYNSRINNIEQKKIVPIRESKLTMLFKEYFGDNQNVSVICTINPDKTELLDVRNVLSFGAKALKVKPMKSWVYQSDCSSREKSPNKIGNKKKEYKLYTSKKIRNDCSKDKNKINNNNYLSEKKNLSNEGYIFKNNKNENEKKVDEDSYYNRSKSPINKNNNSNVNNILPVKKLFKEDNLNIFNNDNKNSFKYCENENDIKTHNDLNMLLNSISENTNNNIDYNQKELITTNTNNFFVKNNPSKQQILLEEKNKNEFLGKLNEKKEEISNLMTKQIYLSNMEQNIRIYKEQCNDIDISEAEALIKKINEEKIYCFKNPFSKQYDEEKIYIKSNQENFMYKNIPKPKISYEIIDNPQINYLSKQNNINNMNKNLCIYNNSNINFNPFNTNFNKSCFNANNSNNYDNNFENNNYNNNINYIYNNNYNNQNYDESSKNIDLYNVSGQTRKENSFNDSNDSNQIIEPSIHYQKSEFISHFGIGVPNKEELNKKRFNLITNASNLINNLNTIPSQINNRKNITHIINTRDKIEENAIEENDKKNEEEIYFPKKKTKVKISKAKSKNKNKNKSKDKIKYNITDNEEKKHISKNKTKSKPKKTKEKKAKSKAKNYKIKTFRDSDSDEDESDKENWSIDEDEESIEDFNSIEKPNIKKRYPLNSDTPISPILAKKMKYKAKKQKKLKGKENKNHNNIEAEIANIMNELNGNFNKLKNINYKEEDIEDVGKIKRAKSKKEKSKKSKKKNKEEYDDEKEEKPKKKVNKSKKRKI